MRDTSRFDGRAQALHDRRLADEFVETSGAVLAVQRDGRGNGCVWHVLAFRAIRAAFLDALDATMFTANAARVDPAAASRRQR